MPHASRPGLAQNTDAAANARGATAGLAKLVYRSKAVRQLTAPELHELTAAAQARNQREAITGLMLYDNERFFQWLEGPADGVGRVMDSIRVDPRHTEVEVLESKPARARTFADWSMKLATPVPVMSSWRKDVIAPPSEIVEALRNRPEAAPHLLVKLGPWSFESADGASDDVSHLPLSRKTAAILKSVFLTTILPQVSLQEAGLLPAAPPAGAHPRALELAELLVAADSAAAVQLLEELLAAGGNFGLQSATLFEPAARQLGDLWGEDNCSELDVTLGLCRLQAAARLFNDATTQRHASRLPQPVVLIVPEPGELHRLGAALDRTVLQNAGWAPHCEYPADNQALADIVSASWFDVLDLSLSAAFRREQTLDAVTETIAEARRASQNPAMAVVVAGRVFVEEAHAGLAVGADLASVTARDVNRSILRTVSNKRTNTVTAAVS